MRKRKTVCVLSYLLKPLHFALPTQRCNGKHRNILPRLNLSRSDLTKILSNIWFEVKVPHTRTAKQKSVNDCSPHDRVLEHIECAERGRIHDYQHKYRHYEMTRPSFPRDKTVRDRRHQAADHRD